MVIRVGLEIACVYIVISSAQVHCFIVEVVTCHLVAVMLIDT